MRLLVPLLVRHTGSHLPEPRHAFAERLSRWLGWTDAIALSAALNRGPAAERPVPLGPTAVGENPEVAECAKVCARVHANLTAAILADTTAGVAPRGTPRRVAPGTPAPTDDAHTASTDFATRRWHYRARQQAMEAGIAPLRARLRAALTAASPALAELAAIDAVMEQALGSHQRRLLATVPALLERRFAGSGEAATELQAVLLAELEVRWQPVEALLDALRQPR